MHGAGRGDADAAGGGPGKATAGNSCNFGRRRSQSAEQLGVAGGAVEPSAARAGAMRAGAGGGARLRPGAPVDPAGIEPSFPRLLKARSYHMNVGPVTTGKSRLTEHALKLFKT